jgi:protein O-mannosyl-transferase
VSKRKQRSQDSSAADSDLRLSVAYALGAAAFLGVIIWAIYDRGINSPFIFDDPASVLDNPSIRAILPLVGDESHPGPLNPPRELPTAGRPLVNLSLAVNFRLGGLNPAGYHIFNIIVHWLSAVLLGGIIWRTLGLEFFAGRFERARGPLAFATALIWAVHPLNTETVVYVTQRTELMVGFFYLATLFASLGYWTSGSIRRRSLWLIVAAASCAAGMACKEVMVTAPVVILLFERTFVSGTFRKTFRTSWPLYVALSLTWLVLLALNVGAPRSRTAGFHLEVPAYVWWFTQAEVLWMYFKLAVWPWPLVIHYATPYLETLSAAWPWLLGGIILAAASVYFFWRRYAAGFAGFAVFVILSPTLVVPIITEVAAERRMYLPLAAVVALSVIGLDWSAQQLRKRLAGAVSPSQQRVLRVATATGAGAIVLLLSLTSYRRVGEYCDPLALWSDAALHQSNDPVIQNNLAIQLDRAGRPREAIEHYHTALEFKSDDAEIHNNLGIALADCGEQDEAIKSYLRALQLNPRYAEAHYNLANVLKQEKRYELAVEHYQRALAMDPDFVEAHTNLAVVLIDSDRPLEALDHCRAAIRLNRTNVEAFSNEGVALARIGKTVEAISSYRRALELDAAHTKARFNLANALARAGQSAEAIAEYRKVLELRPSYIEARNNLGNELMEAGQRTEALAQFEQVTAQKPDSPQAHFNLANALSRIGLPNRALTECEEALHLKPDYIEACANLAAIYAEMGQKTQAIAAGKRALEMARVQGRPELVTQLTEWLRDYSAELSESAGKLPKSP